MLIWVEQQQKIGGQYMRGLSETLYKGTASLVKFLGV